MNETMNAKISARIIEQIKAGKSLEDAINAVLGAGTYSQIVDDLYDALRK